MHGEHDVGCPDLPAFGKLGRGRQVLGIARGSAGVSPGDERFFITFAQAAVIRENASFRIGVPGRHQPARHFLADRLGPGPRLLVSQQRHGRDFALAMTTHAVFVKDRCDILGKRRGAVGLRAQYARRQHRRGCGHYGHNSAHHCKSAPANYHSAFRPAGGKWRRAPVQPESHLGPAAREPDPWVPARTRWPGRSAARFR